MNGLVGGILIGGSSRRMGTPKHLLKRDGQTLLDRTIDLLAPRVEEIVVLGSGALPPGCTCRQLSDWGLARGPVAGIRAGLAWAEPRGLLLVACDLPHLDAAALDWLLAARTGSGVVPVTPDGRVQPLLAIYESALVPDLDQSLALRPALPARALAALPGVIRESVPDPLGPAWTNANTPEDWRSAGGRAAEDR